MEPMDKAENSRVLSLSSHMKRLKPETCKPFITLTVPSIDLRLRWGALTHQNPHTESLKSILCR